MFKVFNSCLTTITSGHDQTKINILQLFHVVINRTNVDYVALLWWDFMNNVRLKKEAIWIEEDYHSIKDDIPLVSVYTTRDVRVRGMLILVAFLTEEIYATDDFKDYETVFMTGKKRKQSAGESSSPRQSHKITIKRKKPSTTPIPPPSGDRERDEIAEATILIEGDEDEESYASEFADSVLNDDVHDSGTRLELESHKENPKNVDDDDVEIEKEKKDDIENEKRKERGCNKVVKEKYIVDNVMDSTKIRKEHKQTPIPSPTRSFRNVSSFDKTVSKELTTTASPTTATTSIASSTTRHKKQSISFRSKTLPGMYLSGKLQTTVCLIRSCIKNKFVTHDFFMSKICEVLDHCNKVIPDTTFAKTKEMITQEMSRLVNLAVNKDREVDLINAKEMIAKEFATHGPKMIEELFRKHM
ncbi:hypothetical protein Tco_0774064 [Tanacetum coccineum]|uniref:SPK domain-containing protein n=1 Tax=Tanacetum coccineum TaxID=301880 RepID=A0ABQ4ZRG8_9ASTR